MKDSKWKPQPPLSVAVKATTDVLESEVFRTAMLSRDNNPFAVCASYITLKAMQDRSTLYEACRSWVVKGVTLGMVDGLMKESGAHIVSLSKSLGGSWHMIAAWQDAVVTIDAHIGSQKRRRYRRSGLSARTQRIPNPMTTPCGIRIEFISRTDNDPLLEQLVKLFRPHATTQAEQTRRKVFVLSQTMEGLVLKPIGTVEEVLIRENYCSTVLDAFDHVASDVMSPDPCGRLVLIHGPTGTGKTYLVRGLVEAVKGVRFVLVPSALVAQLTSPGLAELLAKQRIPTVLIIEDADMLLAKRMGDNMSSISAMLNLADGIFGALSDVRIVCTTNATKLEFDEAILREGRLCRNIEIPNLKQEHAQAVYRRLVDKDLEYAKARSLAQVYRDARNAGWKPSEKDDDVVVKSTKVNGRKKNANPSTTPA